MVMPLLSVTFIGIVIGIASAVTGRTPLLTGVIRAVIGAWLGFVAGAFIGVLVDLVMGGGATLAILGHAGAGAGAAAAAFRAATEVGRRKTATPSANGPAR